MEPIPHQYQKEELIGSAKKRQTNSHLPNGKLPGPVKKYIMVKNSHNEEVGMPRHPQPSRPLGLEKIPWLVSGLATRLPLLASSCAIAAIG